MFWAGSCLGGLETRPYGGCWIPDSATPLWIMSCRAFIVPRVSPLCQMWPKTTPAAPACMASWTTCSVSPDGLHPGAAGDQDRHGAVAGDPAEVLCVVGLDEVSAVFEADAGGRGHGVWRSGVGDALARAGQRLDHERQVGAQALAGHPGDDTVGLKLDGDSDESHQHHAVGPEEESVFDGVEKAPLRVGEPVLRGTGSDRHRAV